LADARLEASDQEVPMFLLIAATVLAIIAVSAAWGSGIDAQARFRLETVRPLGTGARPTPAA
jgi:hypothetical protein